MAFRSSLPLFIFVFVAGFPVLAWGDVYRVNAASAASSPDGMAWATAFRDIQAAVDVADAAGGGEIWVARGAYVGTADPVLTLKDGVAVYGGFFGDEDARDARDVQEHVTLIDGENQRTCIVGATGAILDGFTITRGRAPGGGGMRNDSGASPTVKHCIFLNNESHGMIVYGYGGGGMMNRDHASPTIERCHFIGNVSLSGGNGGGILNVLNSSPVITDCHFVGNRASAPSSPYDGGGGGGGLSNQDHASATITDCSFIGNTAEGGGGIINGPGCNATITRSTFFRNISSDGGGLRNGEATLVMRNCWFQENYASGIGGGVSDEGSATVMDGCTFRENRAYAQGGAFSNYGGSPQLANCVFSSNQTHEVGGAVHNTGDGRLTMANCTLVHNAAGDNGNGISNESGSCTVVNSILWNPPSAGQEELSNNPYRGTAQITFSCVRGGFEGVGNIDAEPSLVNSPRSVQLRAGSSCVDAGTAEGAPSVDLLGRPRPTGARIDMGAYEGGVAGNDIVALTIKLAPLAEGHAFPSLGVHLYGRGELVVIGAQPMGMKWNGWTGNVSSTDSILRVILSDDMTLTANFIENVFRVNAAQAGASADGRSWASAYADIQSAIDAAALAGGGEVWVAKGTYTGSASPIVALKPGVALYGGFNGTETSRTERDWNANRTVIDGAEEYGCVIGTSYAVFDGFVVTRGLSGSGGGMSNIFHASPLVSNCTFLANTAHAGWTPGGGGMRNEYDSSPTITNCVFERNTALGDGGGMANRYGSCPQITGCRFVSNSATEGSFFSSRGGAIYDDDRSAPTVTNCQFLSNVADDEGGGIYSASSALVVRGSVFSDNRACSEYKWYGGGGISSYSATVENCLFVRNFAPSGGAIMNSALSTITNCTFYENEASNRGAAVYNEGYYNSLSKLTNCILWNNRAKSSPEIASDKDTLAVSHCCIQGGAAGDNNIAEDPQFVGAPYSLQLRADSPCIDSGSAIDAPAEDIDGRARPLGAGVDIGAYEADTSPQQLVSLTLAVDPPGYGELEPGVGTHTFVRGKTVVVRAHGRGMRFSHWTGNASGASATTAIVMDTNKTVTAVFEANIYRVDLSSDGASPDGRSWPTAYVDVQDSVDAAAMDGGGEVWIASGTYSAPESGVYSGTVVTMREGVALYGGFLGSESSRTERDWLANKTVIDGANRWRCVLGADRAVLDGFTIAHGRAVMQGKHARGGGMYNWNASPTVMNCVFLENEAPDPSYNPGAVLAIGGAMCNWNASPFVRDCAFFRNRAGDYGGAIYSIHGAPAFVKCVFYQNAASVAGAIMNSLSDATFAQCSFSANQAESVSAIYNDVSSVELINSTFASHADIAIFNTSSSPRITNCTFSENASYDVYNDDSSITAVNCIFWSTSRPSHLSLFNAWNSSATIQYSCVQGGYPGEGNIDSPPRFVGAPQSLALSQDSPCIDAGTFSGAPAADILERTRPSGEGIDMGAFEGAAAPADLVNLTLRAEPAEGGATEPAAGVYTVQRGSTIVVSARCHGKKFSGWAGDASGTDSCISVLMDRDKEITAVFVPNIYYVDAAYTGILLSGRSWEEALPSLQNAVESASAGGGGEVWVRAGTYRSGASWTGGPAALTLREGVSVYGGFGGWETDRLQRDWAVNVTMIDGGESVICVVGADHATLDGFTVMNGYGAYGGGMYNYHASPTIQNCIFLQNSSKYNGGAMGNLSSSPKVINCVFSGNTALEYGGAVYNSYGTPVFLNCTFSGNSSTLDGGGIYNAKAFPTLKNCILWSDASANGEEITDAYESVSGVSFSCIEGGYSGSGNIEANPLFAESAATGDGSGLRLLQGSPCIDTGSCADAPSLDLRGTARPQGGGCDMGAYEFASIETGAITVFIAPPDAVAAGAQWRPVGATAWLASGGTASGILMGTRAVEFAEITGWNPPARVSVSVASGETTTVPEENATYVRKQYTLKYSIYEETGHIEGITTQTVPYEGDGTSVLVVPAEGWYFYQWSDRRIDNPRIDLDVVQDITVWALLMQYQYKVIFDPGQNGYHWGGAALEQVVKHGSAAVAPTVNANYGYRFLGWDTPFDNVTSDLRITALYSPDFPGEGECEGEGEGQGEGEGEGQGEGEGEGQGEGEGEEPWPHPTGCQGCACGGKAVHWTDQLGSWLVSLLSTAMLFIIGARYKA